MLSYDFHIQKSYQLQPGSKMATLGLRGWHVTSKPPNRLNRNNCKEISMGKVESIKQNKIIKNKNKSRTQRRSYHRINGGP
ncbi:hypothetical protein TNCV_4554241 [Trichonephila clavipes]|nr:hypothetical protein TNCV_4554241 [Trichonephila clavipes]